MPHTPMFSYQMILTGRELTRGCILIKNYINNPYVKVKNLYYTMPKQGKAGGPSDLHKHIAH